MQEREGLENIRMLEYVERGDLHVSLSAADVHLISMRPEMTGIVVPGKLYGIMAAARPALFVGPSHCESADTIRRCRVRIHDPSGDAEGVVFALTTLAADLNLAPADGREGPHGVPRRARAEPLLLPVARGRSVARLTPASPAISCRAAAGNGHGAGREARHRESLKVGSDRRNHSPSAPVSSPLKEDPHEPQGRPLILGLVGSLSVSVVAQQPAATPGVAEILAAHDRSLLRDLGKYLRSTRRQTIATRPMPRSSTRRSSTTGFRRRSRSALQYLKDEPTDRSRRWPRSSRPWVEPRRADTPRPSPATRN